MDHELLERLLYQEESEALDFKKEQYPFDNASDGQKSELLKDILAFANAWRQTDAYILIGVKEVRGGRSAVFGVTQHLLNQNLQQFVNQKTNRPVTFSYAPIAFENTEIGVITVPLQDRPVYLAKSYGKLEAKAVYIRRSDTTDIVRDPDELVRMGSTAALARAEPVVEMEFANIAIRKRLGTNVQLESHAFDVPNPERIPLFGFNSSYFDTTDMIRNRNYYRDVATYLRDTVFLCPLGLAVTNPSPNVAEEVTVSLELDTVRGISVLDERDKMPFPSKYQTPAINLAGHHTGRRVDVTRYGDIFEVRAELGAVQPGTTKWSAESFYLGARQSVSVDARVTISANNLRVPLSVTARIAILATSKQIEADEIIRVAEGGV